MKAIFSRLVAVVMVFSMVGSFVAVPVSAANPEPPVYNAAAHKLPASLLVSQKADTATGKIPVMVELAEAPAALSYAAAKQNTGSNAAAELAEARQVNMIVATQAKLAEAMVPLGVEEMYRMQYALNGIAVWVDAQKVAELKSLPGVIAVTRIYPQYPTNASSSSLIGATALWASERMNATGKNVKIGIIDTGIDYLHLNFGGPGTDAVYEYQDPMVITDTITGTLTALFPTAKVVGGWDFVGDAYGSTNASYFNPQPDPDPLACNPHGTHVAGTAAGLGVKDGTTYAGSYTGPITPTDFYIGPGMAPEAKLYALKVFGCTGGTLFAPQAVEWAVKEKLDVINLSLGSDYGSPVDAKALQNAAEAGVISVASSGNSSDVFYVTGSPAVAGGAISVGSTVNAAKIYDGFKANGTTYPSSNSSYYNWANMTAPVTGTLVYVAAENTGCRAFSITATQQITGNIVLVDWSHTPSGGHECGSGGRANNAYRAGAIGVIMAYDLSETDISIGGNAFLPATLVDKAVGDALKAEMVKGAVEVVLSGEWAGSVMAPTGRENQVATHSSRGPSRGGTMLKPDIMAPGEGIFSSVNGPGNLGESWNGTSMAAPHVTGAMALLKQLYPNWTVEELKAMAMNNTFTGLTSRNNLAGLDATASLSRVGAGRINVAKAAAVGKWVLAYNAEDTGLVSVSFGAPEVVMDLVATKTVKVVNKSAYPATFAVGYVPTTDIPGVAFTFSPASLTLAGNTSDLVTVTMTVNAAEMRHALDPLHVGQQLDEEGGYLTLTPNGGSITIDVALVTLPIYAAPRPAAAMQAIESSLTFSTTTGMSATLVLTGTGIDTKGDGSKAAPPHITSLVGAFELQAVSLNETLTTTADLDGVMNAADIRYVGINSSGSGVVTPTVHFAVATWGEWESPNVVEFDIYVDTNRDGAPDYVIFNYNEGAWLSGDSNDKFITLVYNLKTGAATWYPLNRKWAAENDTDPFNSNVMIFPVPFAALGLSANSVFNYWVESYSNPGLDENQDDHYDMVDQTPLLRYNVAKPGLKFAMVCYPDLPDVQIPVTMDINSYAFAQSNGLLLVHLHNKMERAEVVEVTTNAAGSYSPDDGRGRVPVAAALRFVFTTPVLTNTVTFTLSQASGYALMTAAMDAIDITTTWNSPTNTIATITPKSLRFATGYELLHAGAVAVDGRSIAPNSMHFVTAPPSARLFLPLVLRAYSATP